MAPETYTGIVTIDTNKHFITQTLIDANDDIITTNVINHYLTAGRLILLAGRRRTSNIHY